MIVFAGSAAMGAGSGTGAAAKVRAKVMSSVPNQGVRLADVEQREQAGMLPAIEASAAGDDARGQEAERVDER